MESSLVQMNQRTFRQEEGERRSEMHKELNKLMCTVFNDSAWSMERKYMKRYKSTCAIFFGVEHRMRKEGMEEQFNKEAKQGWRLCSTRQQSGSG